MGACGSLVCVSDVRCRFCGCEGKYCKGCEEGEGCGAERAPVEGGMAVRDRGGWWRDGWMEVDVQVKPAGGGESRERLSVEAIVGCGMWIARIVSMVVGNDNKQLSQKLE